MSDGRWSRVRELVEGALDLPEAQREAWVRSRSGDDVELAAEVLEFLAADTGEQDSFLEPDADEGLNRLFEAATIEPLEPDTIVGAYRIGERLGAGGMGVVYRGHRADDQFEKQVAIKVIKRGMDSEEILARFLRERQVLADLEHPGIARLIDGGALEDGRPYLTMEFVEGRDLLTYCDERGLDPQGRLQLFGQVCDALHYAHQRGVVHRDLKPNNILVNDQGLAKLCDFGIAKVLRGGEEQTQITGTRSRPMTLEYASPEQVRGGNVGPTTDVYSLGLVLYRLLTGAKPYGEDTTNASEFEQAICEVDPKPPSDQAGDRRLAGDLDNIVLMALRKEPERRYADAGALHEDIRRCLEGRPIQARPATTLYRLSRYVRRNRSPIGAAVVLLLSVGIGMALRSDARDQVRDAQQELSSTKEQLSTAEGATESHREALRETVQEKQSLIGRLHSLEGTLEDREQLLRTTIVDIEALLANGEADRDLEFHRVHAYLELGLIQGGIGVANLGQTEAAQDTWIHAAELAQELVAQHETWIAARLLYADTLLRVSESYSQLGDSGRALEGLAEARALVIDLVVEELPGEERDQALFVLQKLYSREATLRMERRNLLQAIEAREQALAFVEERYALKPSSKLLGEVADQIDQLGTLLMYKGEPEQAEELFVRAIGHYRSLRGTEPQNAMFWRNASLGLNAYGNFLVSQQRVDEALPLYQESLKLVDERILWTPANVEALRDKGYTHLFLGQAYVAEKQHDQALTQFLAMREAFEGVLDRDPDSQRSRRDVAMSLSSVSSAHLGLGNSGPALELAQAATDQFQVISDADPENGSARRDLVVSHHSAGSAARQIGQREDLGLEQRRAALQAARASYQRALEIILGEKQAGRLVPTDEQFIPIIEGNLEQVEALLSDLES